MKAVPYRGHLIVPADPRLEVVMPHAKKFEHEGQQMFLIPHRVDESMVLKNLGYDVRPPVLLNYDWPGDPFDAQRMTTALITTHRRSFVLNGLGTGKTRSALYAYDYLRNTEPGYGSGLIVAPLSTLRQTWEREVEMVFPHLTCRILHGSRAKRIAELEQPANLYIINHDGVETILAELLEVLPRLKYCVLDELSVYKNTKTDLWKRTYALVSKVERVTGMTGTPMPMAATDAYGQLKMLTPESLRGASFGQFREQTMRKVSQFRWINQPFAVEKVYALMQPAVRFTRDECYDMPPCQTVMWEAQMSKPALQAFQALATEDAIPGTDIAAVNAADCANKMLQVALGGVYRPDRTVLEFDVSSRLQLLESAIEASASKVIVFTPYKSSLKRLVDHVSKRWSCEFVSGDVGPTQREHIFTRFMNSPDPTVLIAHPTCMSHGLTLTEASTIVWWGPPNSLETYEQANARITRAGQRHSQLVVNLVSTKLEQQVFRLLEKRANVQQALLDMFEKQDRRSLL